ncbi:MAG: hydrogenase maturation peptidase HycI [Candidatus Omnitrophica bacterium]|nr:hydrogenase maturation peptidase HycI [Candidatus Omnitrophota bacterium]
MPTLKAAIRTRLKNAKKIALLGVGSELRGDDAAGILIAESLQNIPLKTESKLQFQVFIGSTAPENLTGAIRKFGPTHLIIVDAADIGQKIGTVKLISPDETAGFSSSTHNLPMKIFAKYLTISLGCEVILIGIQPGKIHFNTLPSLEIKEAVKYVSQTIAEVIL